MPFEKHLFPELDESYLYRKFDFGPELYLIPKERSQSYVLLQIPFGSLDTSYRVGQRIKRIPKGTAHFIEHKLFANEDGHDSLELLGTLGANGNAYTSTNSTCYLFSCRENLCESLAELLRFVSTPYFTEENIASERNVIEQEIAMYDDSPSTALYYLAIRAMYGEHPIRESICGSRLSIGKLNAKKLYEVYKAFYHPSRWRIFIAGRFDPSEIEKTLEENLPTPTPIGIVPKRALPSEPSLPVKSRVERHKRLHLPLFALGLKYDAPKGTPEKISREAIARDLVISVLLGKSGSLYESLYDRRLVTAPLASTVETLSSAAYLLITGESENPDLVLDEITAALADAANGHLEKADFERMKRVAYSDFLASLDSTEELAEGFCSSVIDGIDLFTYGRLLSEIDYDYASEVFRRDFDPARLVRARLLPK